MLRKFVQELPCLTLVVFLLLSQFRIGKVEVGFVGIVEVGHEAEVIVVGDGVVFVGVALGAPGGET